MEAVARFHAGCRAGNLYKKLKVDVSDNKRDEKRVM